MRPMSLLVAVLVSVVLSCGPVDAGQQTPGPAIRSVVADVSGDLLTITGTGFGAEPVVTIDGQPVAVLPGGSDTQVVVQAPAVLKTVPGAYRLTLVDPVQNAGDVFVLGGPQVGATSVVAAGTAAVTGGAPKMASAPGDSTTAAVSSDAAPTSGIDDKVTIDTATNTALGSLAMQSITSGTANAALGLNTLRHTTTGNSNTATGAHALGANTTGYENTAAGTWALGTNVSSGRNAAFGYAALYSNTVGNGGNTGVGYYSLFLNNTGTSNVGVGEFAGYYATTGSYNISLGSQVYGETGDTNTTRIGSPYNGSSGQNRTFISGIRNTTVTGGSPVVINASHQLGLAPAGPYFTDTGRLGVGLATPAAKLQLLNDINDGIMVRDGVTQGIFYTSGLLGRSLAIGTQSPQPVVFGTNNSFDRMTIAANGNVGIGTYFPVAKLDVIAPINNGVRFSDGTTVGIFFPSGILGNSFAIGTQSNHALVFGVGDQWGRLTIAPSGNVGVGTLAPQHPLHMASGAYASSGGAWVNASSRALKDQIAALPAAAALAAFDHLEPVTFVYKADPGETHVGFIAEDVPELVATADRKSLSAMDIVALVTRVVQVQREELGQQRQQIQAQQAVITELMQRLSRLEAGQRSDTPVVTATSR